MIYLILTIFCSTSIALILKQNNSQNGEPVVLLSANYLVCAIISFIYLINVDFEIENTLIIFGIFLGGLFVLSFFAFAKAVSLAGTALATVSSRLSVIVPIILTIFIFKEIPTIYQLIGISLALATIYLFYLSLKNDQNQLNNKIKYLYLIGVLIGIGINDFCMKIFEQNFVPSGKPIFLFSIFFSAFFYCLIFIIIKKLPLDKKTILRGAILGIPNVYSTVFLIGALSNLPAVMVYPLINIGIIVLTTILVVVIYKEKINNFGFLSLGMGIIAIIFLSI